MKKNYSTIYVFIIFILLPFQLFSQVGIGTNQPQGMLDISNSNFAGIVFPRVALVSAISNSPVENPNGGPLAEGTVVFNTSNTSNGINDVYPGIYAWNGTRWTPQFLREDSQIYKQNTLAQRVTNSASYVDVNGLGAGSSFVARYTGMYRVKADFNFGAGRILPPSSGDINMATQEGFFRFTFDGSAQEIYTHAYSLYNGSLPSSVQYTDQFRHDTSLVLYRFLRAGQTYDFQLEIDMFVSSEFENGGDSGDGRAYVGIGVPCSVEFTFLDEN